MSITIGVQFIFYTGKAGGKTMDHKGTVMLETDRLILRRFAPDDIDQIYNIYDT